MLELIVTLVCLCVLITLGIIEKRNNRNVEKLKIRINVNGIRGKSTITRMTCAVLKKRIQGYSESRHSRAHDLLEYGRGVQDSERKARS